MPASPRSSGCGRASRRHPVHRRCQARRHRHHRRAPGSGALRRARRGRGDRSIPTSAATRSRRFLERSDRFVYVLCRTSNPGAAEFQNLDVDGGEPLYLHVARQRRATGPSDGDRSAWSSAPPRRPSSPRSARPRPTCRSSCRASARRAATSRPCWQAARSRAAPPRAVAVARCWSTCRAASPRRALPDRRSRGAHLRSASLRLGETCSSARIAACRSTSGRSSCCSS